MAEIKATMVEIPLDEYFDLRQKAEMNGSLMRELGQIQERLFEHDQRFLKIEGRLSDGKVY